MAVLVLLHAGLVTWAAVYASRRTWGGISGPGFYVALLPLAAFVLWRRWRMRRPRPEASEKQVQTGRQVSGRAASRGERQA